MAASGFALGAFGFKGEVDHHDGVLLHDADEQDDTDDGDEAQLGSAEHECQQRSDASRWQCGEDGDRMNVAFV